MATMNPQFHYLRDSLDIIREDDGTNYVTDTVGWVDCGLAAPLGDGSRTEAQYQDFALVVDFASMASDASTKNLEISLLLNSSESESGAVVHRLRLFDDGTNGIDCDGLSGRVLIPLHNFDMGSLYRYVGVKFDFTGAIEVTWGAYFSKC